MSNYPTVTVTCPCGSEFDREVKRGRPAVWCPECRKVPVAQRVARVEAETGDPVVTTEKVSRFGQHDRLGHDQREAVEANVKAVDAEYRARVAEYKVGHVTIDVMSEEWRALSDWYTEAMSKAYTDAGVN